MHINKQLAKQTNMRKALQQLSKIMKTINKNKNIIENAEYIINNKKSIETVKCITKNQHNLEQRKMDYKKHENIMKLLNTLQTVSNSMENNENAKCV